LALGGLLVIDFLIFEPLAWILGIKSLEKWAKLISITLVVAGTHFDMLAS
jgi:hypothetical protein